VVIDKVIGPCRRGQYTGIVPETEVPVQEAEPAHSGRPARPVKLGLEYLVVSFQDRIDLGDEKGLVPGIHAGPSAVARVPAGVVAVFLVAPAVKLLSAVQAFERPEVWVKWAHSCISVRYPF